MNIIEQERDTYDRVWGIPHYSDNSPGENFLPVFLDMAKDQIAPGQVVLDAGCGGGRGALALQNVGFEVELCDLTPGGVCEEALDIPFHEACLWRPLVLPREFDWVYCCDVMEHLPTPFTMLAISQMVAVAKKGLFLSICVHPDMFGVYVGKSLHQTVQSYVMWRDQLKSICHVIESRDLMATGVFLVRSF